MAWFPCGWAALPIDMIRAFSGRSCLPVYEFSEHDVEQPRREISPRLAQPTAELPVDAWRLAHAVKKADCARWPTSRILWPTVTGFLLENIYLFDWNSKNLRLSSSMSDFHADFSGTSLSGRIGQGMALLFLEDRGYSYLGRFTTLYPECSRDSKTPDFVVENNSKDRVLAESKGGFMRLDDSPGIKDRFRKALTQLRGGHEWLSSGVDRGFAIGTFLREIGDRRYPSLTAYVETDLGKPRGSIDLPPDAILRANYAAWLSMMGLDGPAFRLRAREGRPQPRQLPRLALGKREYVVAIASIRPSYRHHAHDPDLRRLVREWMGPPIGFWHDGVSVELIGLDLEVVHRLEATLRESVLQATMEVGPAERHDVLEEFEGGEFRGSVFSDGSLIGEISTRDIEYLTIGSVEVEL